VSAFAVEPVVVDVDMSVVVAVVERARGALSVDDHTCLESLVQTFVELTRLVRERGTTIVRLRRLFGLAVSEKSVDVLGVDTTPTTDADAADADAADATATDTDAADESASRSEAGSAAKDATTTTDPTDNRRKRKGSGRIGAEEYRNAEHVAVDHPHLHAGDVCPGCAHGKLYGLDPATTLRVFGQSPLVARAWDHARLRCSGCGVVFTAPSPEEARGPKYDATAVSMMAFLRYEGGMPLHRLEQLQAHVDTPVPASTQWEVVAEHIPIVEPVWNVLRRLAAQGTLFHNDDTSVRILSLMGTRRAALLAAGELPNPDRTGLFTTAVFAITDAGPIALFFSGRQHAGENLGALLDQRTKELPPPIQMADGLDRTFPADHDVVESNCLVHARRNFVDEVDNFPAECRHVLEALARVFHNESVCVEQALSPADRLALHQRESAPVMTDLKFWMNAELEERRVEPNSGLGRAFQYMLKRWDELTLFLRREGAALDNNICERALKVPIRQRNGSLFYRNERGARVGDIFMALIHTAKLHDVNPFAYLVALLQHEHDVAAAPDDWLPWNYQATLSARASPPADAAAMNV
jgi:transposase